MPASATGRVDRLQSRANLRGLSASLGQGDALRGEGFCVPRVSACRLFLPPLLQGLALRGLLALCICFGHLRSLTDSCARALQELGGNRLPLKLVAMVLDTFLLEPDDLGEVCPSLRCALWGFKSVRVHAARYQHMTVFLPACRMGRVCAKARQRASSRTGCTPPLAAARPCMAKRTMTCTRTCGRCVLGGTSGRERDM